jgi:hypothetical protein
MKSDDKPQNILNRLQFPSRTSFDSISKDDFKYNYSVQDSSIGNSSLFIDPEEFKILFNTEENNLEEAKGNKPNTPVLKKDSHRSSLENEDKKDHNRTKPSTEGSVIRSNEIKASSTSNIHSIKEKIELNNLLKEKEVLDDINNNPKKKPQYYKCKCTIF